MNKNILWILIVGFRDLSIQFSIKKLFSKKKKKLINKKI